MGLRKILTGFFSRSGKKAGADKKREAHHLVEPSSPYAEFMESDPGSEQHAPDQVKAKDIFLLDNVISKSIGTVGLFYPQQGTLLIRDPYKGKAGRLIRLGSERDMLPLFGDWYGDGRAMPGFYDQATAFFYIWSSENEKAPQIQFYYGVANSDRVPLVGDWDGDGKDGIGIYAPDFSCFLLRNELSFGAPDLTILYGRPGGGYIPLAGDWNGDGKDGIGLYNPDTGEFLLRNELSAGEHEIHFRIANPVPGLIPLVGDWDGNGTDSVGCYDPNTRTFYLCNQLSGDEVDVSFQFGARSVPGKPFSVGWIPDEIGRDNDFHK